MKSRALPLFLLVAGFLIAAPASAKPRSVLGRVFSLNATLDDQQPNGDGQDVNVDVDLTMVFRLPSAALAPEESQSGLLRMVAGVESTAQAISGTTGQAILGGSVAESQSSTSPFTAPSGKIYLSSPLSPPSSSSFHFTTFSGVTGTGKRFHKFIAKGNGGLPGIDWGDGSIVPVTSIPGPPISSSTTTSGAIFRHFRGSFSHYFADQSPRTVRFASSCCVDSYSHGDGNLVTNAGTFSASSKAGLDLSSMHATQKRSGTTTFFFSDINTTTFTFTETPLHLTSSRVSQAFRLVKEGISQLTDTVELAVVPTAVPATSGMGLALLAVGLLVAGTILLRRG